MKKSSVLGMAMIIVMSLAGKGWTVEEPPDSLPDPSEWAGWQSYDRFDIETTYPSFGAVFDVLVSSTVNEEWDSTTMATFIQLVLDEEESNDTDIFPVMWSYFCYTDTGSVYDGIEYGAYNSILLYIYDSSDFSCPPASYYYCRGYSWFDPAYPDQLVLSASDGKTPDEVARDAFAHEIQHLCWAANGFPYMYRNANESMSTAAEYMWKAWETQPPNVYDISYDACVFRCERCDPLSKYLIERFWMGYLYEHFIGSISDLTDDLIYKWIRQKDEMGYSEVTMRTLSHVLEGSEYDWIDGVTGDERLATVFQWFLVAKFCDAPDFAIDSRFGYEDFSPVGVDGLFLNLSPPVPPGHTPQLPVDCPGETRLGYCPNPDPPVPPENTGPWNVRILPPSYELGTESENAMTEVSGIYRDGDDTPADTTDGDKSRDYIDIAIYGTDYIIFKAGDYFQDDDGHEFHFSLEGESPTPPTDNTEVMAWVIGYNSAEDTLQLHPEDIVFIEPMSIHPDSTSGSIVVTDFGRGIKSVVIAITLVETIPETHFTGPEEDEYFTYTYKYGVYTTQDHSASWRGNVFTLGDVVVGAGRQLSVTPGTKVLIWPDDLSGGGADTSGIELNIEGYLDVNGTAENPVVIRSWDPSSKADWVGFYFDSTSNGGQFSHCTIKHAEYGIETYAPMIALNHCFIDSTDVCGIAVQSGTTVVENSVISNSDVFGAFLDASTLALDSCTFDDNYSAGVELNGLDALFAYNSTFSNNDRGLILNFDAEASIYNCLFEYNDIGISLYQNVTTGISSSTFQNNTTDGIFCNHYSITHIEENDISYNDAGIYCYDNSSPLIENNTITYNYTGVYAANGSDPDIGNSGVSGQNSIHHSTGAHVANTSPNITVMAEDNWWGSSNGPKHSKIVGYVDYDPWLQSPPTVSEQGIVEDNTTTGKTLPSVYGISRIVPNPFNPTTTIYFQVPPPGGEVRLVIYNVAGQVVKVLLDDYKGPGYHDVTWDGVNELGESVSSSVYFARMSANDFGETKKLVLLK